MDDRYEVERAKWDAHARHQAAAFKSLPPEADFGWFCAQDELMPGVGAFLGDVRDKRVIEYGCGLGAVTVLLARSGAKVSAFDLSEASIEVASKRARELGVEDRIEFAVAPGEALPYEDASFDLAFGKAVLHHLDATVAGPELARVVKPGGRAAFSEPLGTNPVVNFARNHLPYPSKHERGADIPLRRQDITAWMEPFPIAELRGVQLFSMVERGFGFSTEIGPLRWMDKELLRRYPGLWPMCRYGVLTLVR